MCGVLVLTMSPWGGALSGQAATCLKSAKNLVGWGLWWAGVFILISSPINFKKSACSPIYVNGKFIFLFFHDLIKFKIFFKISEFLLIDNALEP